MSERKRRFAITSTDIDIGSIIIDEKRLLEALGYEIESNSDVPALEDELIKYELIEQIKRKGSTLTIFMRYIFTREGIQPVAFLRFRYGDDFIDFPIHDSETAVAIVNALKRVERRFEKIKKIKRKYGVRSKGLQKQYEEFKKIEGKTLAELQRPAHENQVNSD